MLDFIVLLVVLLCGLRGYQRGAVRNVFELLALVIAWAASAPLWFVAGRPLMAMAGWSHTAAYLGGRVAVGVVIYVPLLIASYYADKRLGRTSEGRIKDWNKALGSAFGLLVGLLFGLFLLFMADTLVQGFPAARGRVVRAARRSVLRKAVANANPARRFLVTDVLQLLNAAKRDPKVLERLSKDPRVRDLMENPTLWALQHDPAFAAALRDKRVGDLLGNENLEALLGDKQLRAAILSPETRAAIKNAVQSAAEPPG